MSDANFSDQPGRSRFELAENGHIAFASYTRAGEVLTIPYVEAPPALRGTGAAARLMTEVAAYARGNGLKVIPVCPYAVAWFRKHPDQRDILG